MRFEPGGWHPQSQFVQLGGDRAHLVDPVGATERSKTARPVILLHGILVSSWAWRHNLGPLSASGLRPIAVCQKGFGWSSKRGVEGVDSLASFVLRLADHLELESFDLVGNSLGGAVALRLALDAPDRVGRLVLVSPAVVPPRPIAPFLRLQSPHLWPAYRLAGRRRFYQWILQRFAYSNLPVDAEYMRWFYGPLRGGAVERSAGAITRRLPADMGQLFGEVGALTQPSLLVWGANDGLLPLRAGHILERTLPNTRLVVFPESAHCPMEENPDRFNPLVAGFLAGAEHGKQDGEFAPDQHDHGAG